MKKIIQYGVCICLCTIALSGCGQVKEPDTMDTSSLSISRDGRVTSWLVDVFDKEYYTVAELESMAAEEAAAYNTEHQTGETVPVTVQKVEVPEESSDKVVVTMEYDSTESFSDFNESLLFYGTVGQALSEGYDLSVELADVKSKDTMTAQQLGSGTEKHILITDEKVKLYCPRRVTHVSEGAVLAEDGSVDTVNAESTVYILMK